MFNIKGNAYRLITEINYQAARIFIRHVLTHAEYDKGKLEVMSTSCFETVGKISRKTVDPDEYRTLVGKSLPHVIHTEAENEHYAKILESLDAKPNSTPAEEELAELLTVLIENFENQHYSLEKASPIESVMALMEANGLKRKDLVDVFGTPSIVSDVLNGNRNLTTEHIRRLSERFHVSPELFI